MLMLFIVNTLVSCSFVLYMQRGARGFRVPAEAGNFSLRRVQIGSEAHAASYPMGTRGSFPGGKEAGA